MKAALRIIDTVSLWTGKYGSFLIYVGIALVMQEVVLRYVFNSPTIWGYGTYQRTFAFYHIIGGAYVLLCKAHINMDLIYNKLPLRQRAILDVLTFPIFLAFTGVLLWYGSAFAWVSLSMLEECGTPFHAPVYPVKIAVPIAAFLILLQGLAGLIRSVITAITGRQCEY